MSDPKVGSDRVPEFTQILLIDDDPIFRLGLRTALEAFPDLQVVAEADTGAAALELLGTLQRLDAVDLVILEMLSGRSNPNAELKVSRLKQELKVNKLKVEGDAPSVATASLSEDNLQQTNLGHNTDITDARINRDNSSVHTLSNPSGAQHLNLQPSNLPLRGTLTLLTSLPLTLVPRYCFASRYREQPSNLPLRGTQRVQPSNPSLSGLPLCQRLKADYPNLPVLLLTAESEPAVLVAAKEYGIEGYCAKKCAIAQIVQTMRQLMSGQSSWQTLPTLPPALTSSVRPPRWHSKLRSYGLRQIEESLAQVTQQLQNPSLSNLDWLFWSGRRRELLAARWVVNQLLPTDVIVVEQQPSNSSGLPTDLLPAREETSQSMLPASVPAPTSQISRLSHQSTPFDSTLAKLQSGLSNVTGVVLEIDILQAEKKRDLLYIVLQKFKEILEELRFSQVTLEQLPQKRSLVLQDLWQVSVTEFFGKYYTLLIANQDIEIVNVLLQYSAIVQEAILDKIPLVVEFLSHQLFETPLMIDNVPYPAQTPEAISRSEILLQNLIIQVANAVMQPLLNEFADVEAIKQSFYDRHLLSSREIARFRNNLSWKYRLSELLSEPQAIFESRYNLFFLSDTGIKQTYIYAPRREELEQLRGIQLAVTLAYELRDAIAPRLRAAVAWVGRGVVYVLTQVLGRSIGLVVRGVLQGIGNSIQDTRFGKNGERGK